MIITVSSGDTLFSISEKYGVSAEKIAADNAVPDGKLVIGQSLIVAVPDKTVVTDGRTTVKAVSENTGVSEKTIFRNNYFIGGVQNIPENSSVVLSYENQPVAEKLIGGYAYDFISGKRLGEVIYYMTYIMPFTYGFTDMGELVAPNDNYILKRAEQAGVIPLMHVSTLTEEGIFDSNLPSAVFENEAAMSTLIDNIMLTVLEKNYGGVDVDFEYLPQSEKENYVNFTFRLAERLHAENKILVIAVPPKTSDEQRGSLVEGIDYFALGENADYILIMTYEYGYRFGPAMAIAPENQVRRVLEYAMERIPNNKILLGISNYGYDWTLPFVRGESDAPSISTVEAIELAKKYGAEIMFDFEAMAPYFFYTDENGREHEVWFEDARSFEAKMNLIKEYSLAGGFIWDLMRENPQGFVTINSEIKIK